MNSSRTLTGIGTDRSQHGSALVVTIFMLLVVTGICTTLLVSSSTERLMAANERDSERALFASKAGLGYGYHLLGSDLIHPTASGSPFDSFDDAVAASLEDAQFTGTIVADETGVYTITSTGTYRRASRTTEMVVQITPDAYRYGMVGFNEVLLHVDASHPLQPTEIDATVFSNNRVEIGKQIDLDGSIVASGRVEIYDTALQPTTIGGDVIAYDVHNDGEVDGELRFLASIQPAGGAGDITDDLGNEYDWYLGRNSPESTPTGTGSAADGTITHVVREGDRFETSVFRPDGTLDTSPPINVIRYVPPPRIDYAAMKAAADQDEATYFQSRSEAMAYFASKKVIETIGGETVTTVRVGTPTTPEFIYVRGDLDMTFDPDAASDDFAAGIMKADGLHVEGGIYTSGDFAFTGQVFSSPNRHPEGYHQLRINALPHCFPALVAYSEPSSGSVDQWTVEDTPPIMSGNRSTIEIRSDVVSPYPEYQGPVYVNGLLFAEDEINLSHAEGVKDLITVNGSQMAFRVYNRDYYEFTYDPAVRCTRFLSASGGAGASTIVSYREIR